ncbi:MAG: hypothetical protein JRG89_01285 [Deltaproteobacteria bacterium]|nr:hypothetical protein [Deltaproteobacteria bacterium]
MRSAHVVNHETERIGVEEVLQMHSGSPGPAKILKQLALRLPYRRKFHIFSFPLRQRPDDVGVLLPAPLYSAAGRQIDSPGRQACSMMDR